MVYNTCCACARKIAHSERNDDACETCGKVFCRSCSTLKSKLEMTASQRRGKSCVCQRLIDMKDCTRLSAGGNLKEVKQKSDSLDATGHVDCVSVKEKVETIVSLDYGTHCTERTVSYALLKADMLESSDYAGSSASYSVDISRNKHDADSPPGKKRLSVDNRIASSPETTVTHKSLHSEQLLVPGEVPSLQTAEDSFESSDLEQPGPASVSEEDVVLETLHLPHHEWSHTPSDIDLFQLINDTLESPHHEHLLAPDSIEPFHVPEDAWESPPDEWLNAYGDIDPFSVVEDTVDSLHYKGLEAQLGAHGIIDSWPVKEDTSESLKPQHSSPGCKVASVKEMRAEVAPAQQKWSDSDHVVESTDSLEGTDVDQGFTYSPENKADAPEETKLRELCTVDSSTKNERDVKMASTTGQQNTINPSTTGEYKQPSQSEIQTTHRHVDTFGGLHGLRGRFISEMPFVNVPQSINISKPISSKETKSDHSLNKDGSQFKKDSSGAALDTIRGVSQNFVEKPSSENMPSSTDVSLNVDTSVSRVSGTEDSINPGKNNEKPVSSEGVFGGLYGLRGKFASKSSTKSIYPSLNRLERTDASISDATSHGTYSDKISALTSTPVRENAFDRNGQLYGIERDLFGGESDINHDDIPALDDIPYALLLCNVFNKKELSIAVEKQQQKNILTEIKLQRVNGNAVAEIEPLNHNRFVLSSKKETSFPMQDVSMVSEESGKIQMQDLKQRTLTVNNDPNRVLTQNVPVINTDENKTYNGSHSIDLQSEIREKRIERFAKKENTHNSSYGKQFSPPTHSLLTPNSDNSFIQTKAEISSATFTGLKSASKQNVYPIKSSLNERVTSNGTQRDWKMSPKTAIPLDDNLLSSNLDNCVESSQTQSTMNSPKLYKEESEPKYKNVLATNKGVSVNKGKTQTKVLVHSQGLSESIPVTHDLDACSNTDDEDDVDECDLPTAVKAFLISQGKRRPEEESGNLNIFIIGRKQTSNSRHLDNASFQSTENLPSNKLPIQSNVSLEKDYQSPNGVHFEDKPEFMLKAERDISERSATYARAFDALRKLQASKKIKCISCGNPDCQGDFVQSIQGLMQEARKQGLVVNDVPPDGNCMFTAVCDQLQTFKDFTYTARTLRETSVFWLQDHPYCSDDRNTHFQAFMTENWDAYLQRMIKEGEWGDHVILRAVANITGRGIKILSVNGKASSWTTVEPSSKQPEQIPAILLGHVGESHYTSLRPYDNPDENVSAELKEETSLLMATDKDPSIGDHTTVASFSKDHVDIESKVPMCCLTFLMTSVFPSKTLVDGAARMSSSSLQNWTKIANTWQRCNGHYAAVITGCIADGIYNGNVCDQSENPDVMYIWMDLKILYECSAPERISNYRLTGHGTLCSAGHTYVLHYTNKYVLNKRYSQFNFAITTDDNCKVYAFYVIHWPYWPQEASEWISRVRYAGWPSEEVVQGISSSGCHLIPEAHVSSTNPFKEWRFCFAAAQATLFRNAMSVHQKYCFLVAFGMCFEVLNALLYFKIEWIVNPFLYCCEQCPADFWESSYAACVIMIIDEIRRCFASKYLPNYFIPAWNMIGTLNDVDISAVLGSLENLRAEPLFALRQMHENFQVLPDAETTFDKVKTAAENFVSTKLTTLNVFVPCMIDIAKNDINKGCYEIALESMNEAYQTRLFVATCEDSMSYETFIQGCCSGLNTIGTVWFATYVDKQLHGQLSRTLIQLTMEGSPMKRIDEILDKDISGYFGSSEVPVSMANQFDSFCHDYAMFLVLVYKVSDAQPILYHCHARYQEYLKTGGDVTFSDETMLAVYSGIFALHKRKQNTDVFREILEDATSTVTRVNQPRGFTWLAYVHRMFNDENGAKANVEKRDELLKQMPIGYKTAHNAASLIHWPSKYIM